MLRELPKCSYERGMASVGCRRGRVTGGGKRVPEFTLSPVTHHSSPVSAWPKPPKNPRREQGKHQPVQSLPPKVGPRLAEPDRVWNRGQDVRHRRRGSSETEHREVL